MTSHSLAHPEKRRRLDRVTAAGELCKRRKVKCDGVSKLGDLLMRFVPPRSSEMPDGTTQRVSTY
jgi:hypothetical protein